MADLQRKTANLIPEFSRGSSSMANVNYEQIDSMTIRAYGELNGYTQQISQTSFTLQAGTYCLSLISTNSNTVFYPQLRSTDGQTTYRTGNGSFTLSEETIVVPRFAANTSTATAIDEKINLMLNSGSQPLPYEPHGWVHSLRKLCSATEAIENPLYADGTAITAYTIKGNTVQSGTPTPSNPVDVNGVGEPTSNLLYDVIRGVNLASNGYLTTSADYDVWFAEVKEGETYVGNNVNGTYGFYDSKPTGSSQTYDGARVTFSGYQPVITIPVGVKYIGIRTIADTENATLNIGSQPKPYEPYGYKIPISSDGVTTPIYLGEVETTRNIYKLVLTGNESWYDDALPKGDTYSYRMIAPYIYDVGNVVGYDAICTHFDVGAYYAASVVGVQHSSRNLYFRNTETTLENWKQWLVDQYSNGTPVIVWYRLATPTTGIVNEPLMKIGDYADSISNATAIPTTDGANSITVDTTVQPSEFTATWTGWHNASVKEKSENLLNASTIQNGYTIASDTGLPISSEQRIATTTAMKIPQGTTAITVTYNSNNVGFMYSAFRNGTLIERVTTKASGSVLSLNNIDEIYFSWYKSGSTITTDDVTNIMVNTGSTALPYEPYWK